MPFKCDNCGKGFVRGDRLNNHMASQHSGERPFKCDLCGGAFPNVTALKRHERGHASGRVLFYCPACPKTFRLENYYRKHLKDNHPDQGRQLSISNQEDSDAGPISCVTHTSESEMGIVTAVSQITSRRGKMVLTETRTTGTDTDTDTDTSNAHPYPISTTTIVQDSGAVSVTEHPTNTGSLPKLFSLNEILDEHDLDFAKWREDS
ncbi:C2H2-type zinc finger protein [Candidatus Sororendozoicomonas aggregata]|uniref:C2H2-type zinc finger protein n=1 Tax=Candidatus Sororendozoicomonas aggregata TaxID=3073239 RepID=UPI002ED0180A